MQQLEVENAVEAAQDGVASDPSLPADSTQQLEVENAVEAEQPEPITQTVNTDISQGQTGKDACWPTGEVDNA
jgi:hypothetical protein